MDCKDANGVDELRVIRSGLDFISSSIEVSKIYFMMVEGLSALEDAPLKGHAMSKIHRIVRHVKNFTGQQRRDYRL